MCVLIMWATLVDNKIHVLQRNFILLQNMFLMFRGVTAPNVNLLKTFGVKCVFGGRSGGPTQTCFLLL